MRVLFRSFVLLVIAIALLSLRVPFERSLVTRESIAEGALRVWFKEHASEFDNFSKRGRPVDLRKDGPCYFCAWFCQWQSSEQEYLYRVGLAGETPQESCRTGEVVRVFRQGIPWVVERAPFQISVGTDSWQTIVDQIRRKFLRPDDGRVKTLLENEATVVISLGVSERTATAAVQERYRFHKGTDGLWRGYVSFDSKIEQYGSPEDVLVALALTQFPMLTILGDCTQAQKDRDEGKVCWTLEDDGQTQRSYMLGPAFNPGKRVEVERRALGWEGQLSTAS